MEQDENDAWHGSMREGAMSILRSGEELKPVVFTYNREKDDVQLYALDAPKDRWGGLIRDAILQDNADEVGFVCSTWTVKLKNDGTNNVEEMKDAAQDNKKLKKMLPWGAPRDDPRRIHTGLFITKTKEGDVRMWIAEYDLSADGEVVDPQPFEEITDAAVGQVSSRFFDGVFDDDDEKVMEWKKL